MSPLQPRRPWGPFVGSASGRQPDAPSPRAALAPAPLAGGWRGCLALAAGLFCHPSAPPALLGRARGPLVCLVADGFSLDGGCLAAHATFTLPGEGHQHVASDPNQKLFQDVALAPSRSCLRPVRVAILSRWALAQAYFYSNGAAFPLMKGITGFL